MSEERVDGTPDDAGLELEELDLDTGETQDDLPDLDGETPAAPEETPQQPDSRTLRRLRARIRQQEDENRQMREQMLRFAQPPPPQPDPYRVAQQQRDELERVALMAPQEQAQYYAQQAEQRMNQQVMRARIEVGDLLDRQAFAQLQREEPAARQWARQVEDMLAQARNQGLNPTREALFNQLLAQSVRDKSKREAERQRRAGRASIARQTTTPGNGRSQAAPAARRNGADDYAAVVDRLRNTRIGDW